MNNSFSGPEDRYQATIDERRNRNCNKLIHVIRDAVNHKDIPFEFNLGDIKEYLENFNILQDTNEPFSKGYAGAILSQYSIGPGFGKSDKTNLEIVDKKVGYGKRYYFSSLVHVELGI